MFVGVGVWIISERCNLYKKSFFFFFCQ